MGQSSTAMDRVRRVIDAALIFASLFMLAWPALFAERADRAGDVLDFAAPAGVVIFLGAGVGFLARRWPLVRYAPVSAAVIMAGFALYRNGTVSPKLTWLLVGVSAIILIRQFLGARTNAGLMRDLTRQAAILARQ